MSAVPKLQSQLVAEALRRDDAPMDELRRARGERLFLAAAAAQAHSPLTAAIDPPATRRAPARSAKVLWVGGAVLAAAAGLFLALQLTSTPPDVGPAPSYAVRSTHDDASSAGPVVAGTELALSAGESAAVTLHDLSVSVSERSRLSVEALSIEDVRVALSNGEARFAFHPRDRGHQHVAIRTPSARVEIVGTELTVRVSERGTEVEVHEGVVRVIPTVGDATLVHAGSSLVVPMAVAIVGAAARDEDAMGSGAGEPEAAVIEAPVAALGLASEDFEGMVSGTSAASEGGDAEALEAVEVPSDRDLLARAEALLDREEERRAEPILEQLVAGAAHRADRAHAAMMLGDLRQSSRDYRGALRAYDRAFALARGPIRAHALYEHGHILDRELHDLAAARADYVRYLTEFPDGPNADQTHRRLCELGGADGIACD
jgi:ferric-dicitrate binding protein FerR (iron transport regulator)